MKPFFFWGVSGFSWSKAIHGDVGKVDNPTQQRFDMIVRHRSEVPKSWRLEQMENHCIQILT